MTRNDLLKKFAEYQVSINCNDPLIFKIAGDIIEQDGAIYTNAQGMEQLYRYAKHGSNRFRASLEIVFTACVHTCRPTPKEMDLQKQINEALMRDYHECAALGFSTE
jgi:hypothetical protein